METKEKVYLALVALALSVLSMWAGRTVEKRSLTKEYAVQITQRDEQIRHDTNTLALVMVERGRAWDQLEQMKKQLKTWDKGTRSVAADGKVEETWDRGTDDSEEVFQSLSERIQELSATLTDTDEKLASTTTERDSLSVQLVKKEYEAVKAGTFRGVMLNWDLEGKTWHTALNVQYISALGPLLVGASLRPGGPWRPSARPVGLEDYVLNLGPSVGLGLRF